MPDLDLDEADRCPHCGAILRWPPLCCTEAAEEYRADLLKKAATKEADFGEPDIW